LYDAFGQIELVVLNNSELANITIRGAADPDSLSEAETEIYKMWATQYLDLWERTLIREKDGLIQSGTLEGWDEWYGDWVIRHLTYQMWKDLEWNWTEGTLRTKVEELFVK
jgi:hypothetical protein